MLLLTGGLVHISVSNAVIHSKKIFSQGSSDDGNATLKLHFYRPLMKDTVTEEVICPKL
jgi:hypothetical protein